MPRPRTSPSSGLSAITASRDALAFDRVLDSSHSDRENRQTRAAASICSFPPPAMPTAHTPAEATTMSRWMPTMPPRRPAQALRRRAGEPAATAARETHLRGENQYPASDTAVRRVHAKTSRGGRDASRGPQKVPSPKSFSAPARCASSLASFSLCRMAVGATLSASCHTMATLVAALSSIFVTPSTFSMIVRTRSSSAAQHIPSTIYLDLVGAPEAAPEELFSFLVCGGSCLDRLGPPPRSREEAHVY
mmetsp:Transcript_8470/g.30573  ORF Transcript_8470/g.30573 Transcript_8470/m.30573 type:complete len:249 (-) Transcript_8470:343-1089(-)